MSTTSNASSPASDAPPRALASLAPVSSNGPPHILPSPLQTNSILTHKEWVIPPRPKPGRKPATDNPPTKRKAQNRAAQRAFRERRAARVGELEEQMKAMEEEDEREQEELRSQIGKLDDKLENYERSIREFGERMRALEKELENEKTARIKAESDLACVRSQTLQFAEAVPLRPRGTHQTATDNMAPGSREETAYEQPMGCGKCTINSRCECIEQAFDMGNIQEFLESSSKRPRSPSELDINKRLRQGNVSDIKPESGDLEIDFTTRQPPKIPNSSSSFPFVTPPSTSIDSCGFCQDGTACLCAEIAAEGSSFNDQHLVHHQIQQPDIPKPVTPITLQGVLFQRPSVSGQNNCKNGPGTCGQCQRDPTSTLFCKSLAASRSSPPGPGPATTVPQGTSGSCGNPTGCCRVTDEYNLTRPAQSQVINGPTLSCADAFTTLSRHPAFDRASDELGVWLPQLATVPKGLEGRTAFEIEAASVMGVLRFFDRRFGRDAD